MTFTHKLARRLAQNGVWAGALAALTLLGCESDPASFQPGPSTIQISPSSAVLPPGSGVRFSAAAVSANGDRVAVPVVWAADGGTIDSSGWFVAGAADGAAQITAVLMDRPWVADSITALVLEGVALDTESVRTSAVPVATVNLTPDSATLAVNGSLKLSVTLRDAGGKILTGRYLRWVTTNAAVATVSSAGNVVAKASGTAKIGVMVEGKSDISTIVVSGSQPAPVATVDLQPATATVAVGATLQLTATAKDAAGNVLTGRALAWSSSNGAVATVSTSGLVTGVKAGTASVSVLVEGKSDVAAITIPTTPPPPPSDGYVVVFQDDFETGNLSRTSADFRWGVSSGETGTKPVVVTTIARGGTRSLKFTFGGNASLGDDAWSEQRFSFSRQLSEVVLEWYQYFPMGTEQPGVGPKFVHRSDPGGPENNKFLRLWDDDYTNYRVKVGVSTQLWTATPADPQLISEWGTASGPDVGVNGADTWWGLTDSWRGRWVKVRVRVKLATGSNNNGVLELSLDGQKVLDNQTLALYPSGGIGNYIKNGYLMGWANSGFSQTTYTYVDDFTVLVPGN